MPGASFIPRSYPLDLYAGDGVELRLTVNGLDLDAGSVLAEIRANRDDADPADTFAATVAGDVITLKLTGGQTAALGKFRGAWDVQFTPTGLEPRTLIQGPLTCTLDVSRNGG